MNIKTAMSMSIIAAALVACDSGDVKIQPTTVDNSQDNSVTNPPPTQTTNPNEACASYVNSGGQLIRGVAQGANCFYSESFVGAGNNLRVDMTIPALPNGGAHIFDGSLFVGETYNTNAEMIAAGIFEGGDGPKLTIEAGATLAFQSNADFMIINRGSQLFAVGTATAPITITSVTDIDGTVGPEDVQQWGGLVINGFGVTNNCAYTGSVAGGDLALSGECHVDAEGAAGLDESQYGGDNNDDSSGRMEYLVVKHTGAQVGNGDELNGISFGGVGRNTVINNLQVYSTFDDGIELFGGAVNINNFVAVYARDDSIDIDEGYSGTISNALVIQSAGDGAHCIESDGIAGFSGLTGPAVEAVIAQGINSRPVINNLTCIISPTVSVDDGGTGTHESGAGWRFREGIFPTINNSMVIGSFSANNTSSGSDNYCLRFDNRTQQAALDGDVVLNNVIYACAEARNDNLGNGTTEVDFAVASGNIFASIASGSAVSATAVSNPELQLLEGSIPIYSIAYATSQVDGAAPGAGSDPAPATFIGAVSLGGTDWTQNWTYGIHPGRRAQPLWFEGL